LKRDKKNETSTENLCELLKSYHKCCSKFCYMIKHYI